MRILQNPFTGRFDTAGCEEVAHVATSSLPRNHRPAWIASINLAAARNFLELNPPRLADTRISLLRVREVLQHAEAGGADLSSVATRSAGIASELGQLIKIDADSGGGADTIVAALHTSICGLAKIMSARPVLA